MNNRILYCDDSFAIVNKIAGEVCSFEDGKENDEFYLPTVFKNLISERLGYTPEIIECVNRIDKPVSGIVILALSKDANKELSLQLKFHKIQKKYFAIVEGCFKAFPKEKESCLLHDILFFNKKNQKSYILNKNKVNKEDGKDAKLLYRVVGCGERYSFLEIQLLTGRTHQIRCQLANNKMPIKGDLKYGAKRSEKNGGIRLHAGFISLFHPKTKEKMDFYADFPYEDNLWAAFHENIKEMYE